MNTFTYILKVSQPLISAKGRRIKPETLVLEFDDWFAAHDARRELLQTDLDVSGIIERPKHVVYKTAADALDTAYTFFHIEQHG